MSNILSFRNLTKAYSARNVAVKDFSLDIERGEFVVLIGPSGCGKSTTLRMINRLVEPTSGTIFIDGQDYKTYSPVNLRRRLGYVIQQVGLIPHLTIAENISFVLKLNGIKENERRIRAEELLKLVEMNPEVFMDRYPAELSGGQQQRIGVLRALAHEPDIILMDEPFGALDPITREQLQDELKRLQRSVHRTIIFVTHDMDEAIRMADRIVIMRDGRIVQVANPEQILRSPADNFVADFIGRKRLLREKTEMKIADLMSKSVTTVASESSLKETLEFMLQKGMDIVVAVDKNGRFKGSVSINDVKKLMAFDKNIEEFPMLLNYYVQPDSTVLNCMNVFLAHNANAIPVIEKDETVTGIVTKENLLSFLGDFRQENLDEESKKSIISKVVSR